MSQQLQRSEQFAVAVARPAPFMNLELRFIVYLLLLVLAFVSGAYRWKLLSEADKWLCFLLLLTVLQEIIAYASGWLFRNNLFTYHVYSPLELFIICMYFNDCVPVLRKKNLGLWIGTAGIVLSIVASTWLQPLSGFNSLFLMFEGLCVILLCMFAFYKLLLQEDISLRGMAHFWITVCFLVYWSITYASWGLYSIFLEQNLKWANAVLLGSNMIFYVGILILFLRYPKLRPSGE